MTSNSVLDIPTTIVLIIIPVPADSNTPIITPGTPTTLQIAAACATGSPYPPCIQVQTRQTPRTPPGEHRGRVRRVSVATAAAETESDLQPPMRVSGVPRSEEAGIEEEQGETGASYMHASLGRQTTSDRVDVDGQRCPSPIESVMNDFPVPPTVTVPGRLGTGSARGGTTIIGAQHHFEERPGPSGRRQRQGG